MSDGLLWPLSNPPHPLVCHVSEPYDVYGGRQDLPGEAGLGNPFRVRAGDRLTAVLAYQQWVQDSPAMMRRIKEQRGKRIACHCYPKRPCHCEVVAVLANPVSVEQPKRRRP